MRRTYDRERYLDRVTMIRAHVPDVAISTDIIVGFPGETEEDFSQTLEVVEQVGFDSAFTFVFSPRRGTTAAEITEGIVAHPVKSERMERLVELVQRQARARAQRFVGRTVEVLVEGTSRTDSERMRGRTSHNKVVNFGGLAAPGEMAQVEIEKATSQTLSGEEDLLARASGESGASSGAGAAEQMKIRAAVLEEFAKPLVVQEVELAEPGPGEVLVRLVACGVCHTDMYTASGVDPSGYAPTVLGHEGAGVVEHCGEGVSLLKEGDHVVTLFSPQCGECIHCRSPLTNLCLAIREQQNLGYLPDGTTRLSLGGEPLRHFMGTSTFAEYTVMPEIALARIDPEAPLDRACLFACGLSTGLGAAMKTAEVREGSTCVIFGAGMVGLGAVAGARLQGAERIVCVDLSPERLELARGQGATDLMEGGEDTVERILEMTGGFGADYTFEATGNVKVMRQAVEASRMGWGLCTVCGVAGRGETLEVIPRLLITGRRVCGSSFGGLKGREDVPALIDRYLAGEIDIDPFISHRLTLDEVNRGFELMEAQDGIRSVLEI